MRARDEELIRNLKGAGMLPDGEPRWPGFGQATYCKLPVKPELVKSRTGPAIHLERVVPIEWAPVGGRQTLWEFVKLVEAPPPQVLGFARRRGALEFCKHGQPWSIAACRPSRGWWLPCDVQPLEFYRRWARRARGLLRAAADAHRSQVTQDVEVWRAVMAPALAEEWVGRLPDSLREAKAYITNALMEWREVGDVRVVFEWGRSGPPYWFLGSMRRHLWTDLAQQLIFAVVRAHHVAVCQGCGTPFLVTKRRPPTKQAW